MDIETYDIRVAVVLDLVGYALFVAHPTGELAPITASEVLENEGHMFVAKRLERKTK